MPARGRCPEVDVPPSYLQSYRRPTTRVINCYSEFLPMYQGREGATEPNLHFRMTVRDGRPAVVALTTTT